jgi:hypothetical protein
MHLPHIAALSRFISLGGAAPPGPTFLGYDLVLDSGTSGSLSITVPSGTNYIAMIEGGWHNTASPSLSALTIDGVSFLPVAGTQDGPADGNDIRIYHGAWSNGSGSKTLAFTRNIAWTEGGGMIVLFVSGASGPRAGIYLATPGPGAGSLNGNLTTVAGDLCLVGGWGWLDSTIDVDLAGQTKIFEQNTTSFNSDFYGAAYKVATGTSTNMQMTGSYFAGAALALKT